MIIKVIYSVDFLKLKHSKLHSSHLTVSELNPETYRILALTAYLPLKYHNLEHKFESVVKLKNSLNLNWLPYIKWMKKN